MTPTAANLTEALSSIREKIHAANAERHELAVQLTKIVADAQALLNELGEAQAPTRQGRRGRPPGSKNKRGPGRPPKSGRGPGRPAGTGKKKRTMSPEARARISAAQKARWAKQKAGEKKK